MQNKKSKLYKFFLFFTLLLFSNSLFAYYELFSKAKNAREAIEIANKHHLHVVFRHLRADNLSQFDKIKVDRVYGSNRISLYWYSSVKMPNLVGKGMDEINMLLRDSNIKLKIIDVPTVKDNYNRVIKQNIRPRNTLVGKRTTKNLNPQFYDKDGNFLLTLHVFKWVAKPIKMPDLTGMEIDEVKNKIKELNLPIGYIQEVYTKTIDPKKFGKVFSQSIKAGTMVDKPQYMGLRIYTMNIIRMPNLVGKTLLDVEKIEHLIPLKNYVTTYEKDKDGIIIKQSIPPEKMLSVKTFITLHIYNYENPYFRADYINLKSADAISIAKKRDLKYEVQTVDIFDFYKTTTIGEDFIRNRDDRVGEVKKDGDKLILVVTKLTEKESTMPDLIGLDCQDALKKIYEIERLLPGLEHKLEHIPTTNYSQSGKVIKTSPLKNTKIKSFDKINLYCGMYKGEPSKMKAKIPNLRHKSQEEAIKTLNNLGFSKIKIVKLKETGFVEGTVVDVTGNISISAIGYEIFKSETLKLFVADFQADYMYLMPNLLGYTMEKAKEYLTYRGFVNIKFLDESKEFTKYTIDLPKGTVVGTYPRSKSILKKDDLIELVIRLKNGQSLLEDVKKEKKIINNSTLVPEVVEDSLEKTLKKFKEARLYTTVKKLPPPSSNLKGKVAKVTNPIAKTIVSLPKNVEIFYYPNEVVVPNVSTYISSNFLTGKSYQVRQSLSNAQDSLKKAGLTSKVSYIKTTNANLNNTVSTQTPKAGTSVDGGSEVLLEVFKYEKTTIKPSVMASVRLETTTADYESLIEDFYKKFKSAYELKDESLIISLISQDWNSQDGSELADLEDNLSNVFQVFDEIKYNISNLNIQDIGNNKYNVSYDVKIVGEIYDNDIVHEESSKVQEELTIVNGNVKINKTLGGQYWSQ